MVRNIMLLICLAALPAAAADTSSEYRGGFERGALVFLAADAVNIRSGPQITAPIIDNLPIGFQVTVLEKSGSLHTVDGLAAPWYRISYKTRGAAMTGYVWGGFLSCAGLIIEYGGKPALFLIAVKSAGNSGEIPMHAMVICGAKVVSRTAFNAIGILFDDRTYGYHVEAAIHGPRGFAGIDRVITVTMSYPACGYPFGTAVLMYDGRELRYGLATTSMVEGGVFHRIATPVFPDEKGGVPGSLVVVRKEEEFDEVKNTYVLKKTSRTVHAWDGKRFRDSR